MKYHRYHLVYTPTNDYAVVDTESKEIVFRSQSKSETIGKAQELNGYQIDGDEQSYAAQIGV